VINVLIKSGFTTFIEQVLMSRTII
jgi:hypothetical protein